MTWLGGGTWGDGADWGEDTVNGKLWQFVLHVGNPHYHAHHISHKAEHDKVPGSDGIYKRSGRHKGRHEGGGDPNDFSDLMDAFGGGVSRYKLTRHHTHVQTALRADDGAGNAVLDQYGSAIQTGQMHRGTLENGAPSSDNKVFNPTFANGTNGWTGPVQGSGTGVPTWTTDRGSGGRLTATFGPGAASGQQHWSQTIDTPFSSSPHVVAGCFSLTNTSLTSGANAAIQIIGATSNTVYATIGLTLPATGAHVFESEPFTPSSDTQCIVRVFAYNGASGGQGVMIFEKIQVEVNAQPTPFVDHSTARIIHRNLFAFQAENFDATNGNVTALNYPLPVFGALLSYCVISGDDGGSGISLLIGTRTNGYELLWDTSGNLHCRRWKSGSSNDANSSGAAWSGGNTPAINTLAGANVTRDGATHLFRVAVDNGRWGSGNLGIEMGFDGLYVIGVATDPSGPAWTSGVTLPVTVFSSNGIVQHFDVRPRELYLASSVPYQNAVAP